MGITPIIIAFAICIKLTSANWVNNIGNNINISAVLVQNTSIQVTVSTTIPGFDLNAVKWSVSGLPDTNGWGKNNTGIFVDVFGLAGSNTPYTIDIFASYTYNGETYSSSASVTI